MNTMEMVLSNSAGWAPEVIFPVMVECGFTGNSTPVSCQQEKSELRRKVAESTFLAGFGREVCATLELKDSIDTAARLLYDHFHFDRIEFTLSTSYGGIRVLYNALDKRDAIPRVSGLSGGKPPEVRGYGCLGLTEPKIMSSHGSDIQIPLPADAGLVVLYSAEQVKRGMDGFFDNIGKIFFVAVKNALEHGVVKERSLRDSLTGLFNRRVLEEMLGMEKVRREPVPLALIVLDLDDFKQVNDSFGHPAGDVVLSTFGSILREYCRPADIAVRYGGEEFAVLLSGVSYEAALKLAERLRRKIAEQNFVFAGNQAGITTSIGIAFIANGGIAVDELLSRADQALYHAKQSGKNQVSVFGIGVVRSGERKHLRLCRDKTEVRITTNAA